MSNNKMYYSYLHINNLFLIHKKFINSVFNELKIC